MHVCKLVYGTHRILQTYNDPFKKLVIAMQCSALRSSYCTAVVDYTYFSSFINSDVPILLYRLISN